MNDIFKNLYDAVINGDEDEAVKIASIGIAKGIDPLQLIEEGLTKGIDEVGVRFGRHEMFLPELIGAAKSFQSAVELLNPEIQKQGKVSTKRGKIVIGTVKGDIHDLGKNIVSLLYSVNGFEVIDIGVDVADDLFVSKVKEHQPDVLGLSSMLTNTREKQRDVIMALDKAGLREGIKVIIGGAVVNEEWAESIGADAFAIDANEGINKTLKLIGA
jgi:corrinoid protein of di/trimethylamine methyltransferase